MVLQKILKEFAKTVLGLFFLLLVFCAVQGIIRGINDGMQKVKVLTQDLAE